jgi:mitochondrial chaperone BCS1
MRLHTNAYIEALLYALIPLMVHVVLTPRLFLRALRKTKGLIIGDADKGFVVREIAATTVFASWQTFVPPSQESNHLLQRAIAVHVAAKMKLETTRTDTVYQLTDAPVDRVTTSKRHSDDTVDNDVSPEGEPGQPERYNTYVKPPYSYEQLLRLQISAIPTPNTWAQVESGLFFQYTIEGYGETLDEERQNDPSVRRVTMTFRFRSKRVDASQAIDRLVEEAFLQYQKQQLLAIARDTTRYMFVQATQYPTPTGELVPVPGEESATISASATKKLVFKRYPLGDDKSFKNLFFPDKARILHLLDNFTQRKGKFAVKGFPYKLGLLLHGPPGTGKTSLIKAVAQYTKRHIVSVSLSKIKTNQELMDAVFDLRFPIEGRETSIQLDFQDVVFVMEDIDCAGASVVHARKEDAEDKNKEGNHAKSGRRKWITAKKENDKLNLSGLLNVLDGVIDCPGRIVIMTTNHPEKLDPALIRPGRVNTQLLLGPMASPEVVEMLEYYFGVELTDSQREAVESKTQDAGLTPAAVEEICAERDTVEQAIQALG